MADDAKLLAVIDANTKAFENALKRIEKQIDGTFGKGGRSVKRLNTSLDAAAASAARFGRIFGLAFTGAGAVALAARTIRAFLQNTIESESAVAQLNAVLKSTGGIAGVTSKELQELASELQSVSVFSDEAIIGAESLLLTFTKIGNDVLPSAVAAVLDMSTALGQDLKSSSIQLGKALQDPIKGITALRRVGVNFSESQKAIIADLVKTGQLSKAQAIILKELQTEFGGSARAARDTLGGALRALSEAWGDLFEVSGPASDQLRIAIEDMIRAISDPKFKEAVSVIGVELLNALKAIVDFAPRFSSALRSLPQDIADFTAGVSDFRQVIQETAEVAGRFTGAAGVGELLGLSDPELNRIDHAHDAIGRHATDLELLAAVQKKFTIAPGEPAAGGGVGIVGFDPDAIDEATESEDDLVASIEAEAEAQKEAGRERKRAADELVRQKEAVVELISDLEFEKSLIGLSNEQREIEIALRRAGAAATGTQREEIAHLIASGIAEQQALDGLIDRMDELRSAAGGALSAFNDSLRRGEGLAGGLRSALESVLDTVIRIAEQQAITSLFSAPGSSGGLFSGIIGNLFRGKSSSLQSSALPQSLASQSSLRMMNPGGFNQPNGKQVVQVMIRSEPSPLLINTIESRVQAGERRTMKQVGGHLAEQQRAYGNG